MSLAPGARLGPYEVLSLLGIGGMGEVYRARDTKLQRDVALKILPESFAGDLDRLARFKREAHTLAALNHPHIAAIYGFEDSDGVHALVMELVEGEDLERRLTRGPIPLNEALPIAAQIADALEAAHERGIVHRDLKPANIKVRADGTVKVLDFGLAKALDPADGNRQTANDGRAHAATIISPAALTYAGVILGTAAYMSPEQARGQSVDVRSDLWAFGCVLYEMLTGKRAFLGDSLTDTLAAVVKEEPRWDALPVATSAAIHTLVRRCLAKDRRRRIASASDARLEIEDALNPGAAGVQRHSLSSQRRALTFALGLGLGLIAAVGGFVAWSNTRPATQPAPVTRLVISAPPGTQIVSGHREIAVSPDGRQVAFIARDATDQRIYLRRLDELESRQVAGTEGARDLTLSPDGQWLAFHSGTKIRKVSLSGGVPSVLADAVHAHGLAWHPVEDAIYFAPNQLSAIWKVPANGGSPSQVTTLDSARGELSHEWPVFSRDSRTMLFSINPSNADFDNAEVSILNLESRERQTMRTGGGAFALTEVGDVLFVRTRSVMSAPFVAASSGLTGGTPELIGSVRESSGGNGGTIALSPTGTLAYVPSSDPKRRSLVWISPEGGEQEAGFGQREFVAVAVSSDGHRFAASVGTGSDSGLYLADTAGGPLTLLTKPGGWAAAWSPDGKTIAGSTKAGYRMEGTLSLLSVQDGQNWEPCSPQPMTSSDSGRQQEQAYYSPDANPSPVSDRSVTSHSTGTETSRSLSTAAMEGTYKGPRSPPTADGSRTNPTNRGEPRFMCRGTLCRRDESRCRETVESHHDGRAETSCTSAMAARSWPA